MIQTFGHYIIRREETGSTNDDLKMMARAGVPDGTTIVANHQTAGRGRLGRTWLAPPDSSLLVSLLFRPSNPLPADRSACLGLICALAMIEAVDRITGLELLIKWPNDLVWHNGKKLAGILAEANLRGQAIGWVIVGLGLNVNLNPATAFGDRGEPVVSYSTGQPAIPKDTATSLSQILGRDTADLREPLLQAFLGGVDRLYHDFLFQGYTPHRAANDKLIGSNQAVIIYDSGGQILHQGIIAGLDEKCSLLLRQSDGRMESILSGELTLRSASKS